MTKTGTLLTQHPTDQPSTSRHAIVIGAGLAGATTARALAEQHWTVTVLDPQGIAAGASGNLAGVVYSTASPHLTPQNRFYQTSYRHALRWLHHYGFPSSDQDGQLNGVIQHFVNDKQRDKFTAAMDSGAWPADLLRPALAGNGVELV
ncbi:FAD-dependent oxidoreductase, partial [Alcanivorax sp. HI0044]